MINERSDVDKHNILYEEKIDALYNSSNLSAAAFGALLYLLNLPPETWVTNNMVRQRFNLGAVKTENIMNELIEKGYAKRVRELRDKRPIQRLIYSFDPGNF